MKRKNDMPEKKNALARDHVVVELGDDMLRDISGAESSNSIPMGWIPPNG
ncbi:MAG TPA: hypothetical protein VI248_23955 [Kineosporiaceae bacterium]